MTRAVLLVLLLPATGRAAPPPPASPDAAALGPYKAWIEAQPTPHGGSCCSEADGREVDYRVRDGHYEVRFVHPEDIADRPPVSGRWYPVPDEAVLRSANPAGVGIAWWYPGLDFMQHGSPIRCFAPADGS